MQKTLALLMLLILAANALDRYEGYRYYDSVPIAYFEGFVNDNKRFEGFGVYNLIPYLEEYHFSEYPYADLYQGMYRNGDRSGMGKFDGENFYYIGEVEDSPNGNGTEYLSKKHLYMGEWRNGKKHGRGLYINFVDGEKSYYGSFTNGQVSKVDAYLLRDLPSRPNRLGLYSQKVDSGYVIAMHVNGKVDGEGIFLKGNTITYGYLRQSRVGKDPYLHGYGTLATTDSTMFGNWNYGDPSGTMFLLYDNYVAYYGTFKSINRVEDAQRYALRKGFEERLENAHNEIFLLAYYKKSVELLAALF